MGLLPELHYGLNSLHTANQSSSELQQIQELKATEVVFAENALNYLVSTLSCKSLDGPIMHVDDRKLYIFGGNSLFQLGTEFKKANNVLKDTGSLIDITKHTDDDLIKMNIDFYHSRYTYEDAEENPHWHPNMVHYQAIYYTFHPELASSKVRQFYGITHWRNHNNSITEYHIDEMKKSLKTRYPDSIYHPSSFDGGILLEGPTRPDFTMQQYVERYNKLMIRQERK